MLVQPSGERKLLARSVSPQAWLGGSLQRFHLEGEEDSVVLLGFIDVGSASRITLVGHPCLQMSDRQTAGPLECSVNASS